MKRDCLMLYTTVFIFLLLFSNPAFAFVTPAPEPVDAYLVDASNSHGKGAVEIQAPLFECYPCDDLSVLVLFNRDVSTYPDCPEIDLVLDPNDKFKGSIILWWLFKDVTEEGRHTDGIITNPVAQKGENYGLDACSLAILDGGDFKAGFYLQRATIMLRPPLYHPVSCCLEQD
jgi:hypothetical protein